AANLDKAFRLLQVFADPLGLSPAEVHFLTMTHRDLPGPMLAGEPAELLKVALRTRIQAEDAALAVQGQAWPYSEQVVPWIRGLVDQADQERRQGEDLVF